MFQEGYPSYVRDASGRITPLLERSIESVLDGFADATGIFPGVSDEDQDGAHLAHTVNGMFVHPHILTGMAAVISYDLCLRASREVRG